MALIKLPLYIFDCIVSSILYSVRFASVLRKPESVVDPFFASFLLSSSRSFCFPPSIMSALVPTSLQPALSSILSVLPSRIALPFKVLFWVLIGVNIQHFPGVWHLRIIWPFVCTPSLALGRGVEELMIQLSFLFC